MTEQTISRNSALDERAALISCAVDQLASSLVAFARELVRIPSLPGEEGRAHHYVADKLRSLDLSVDICPIHFDDLRGHPAFNDDGLSPNGRINVIGRWSGTGRGPSRSLILN